MAPSRPTDRDESSRTGASSSGGTLTTVLLYGVLIAAVLAAVQLIEHRSTFRPGGTTHQWLTLATGIPLLLGGVAAGVALARSRGPVDAPQTVENATTRPGTEREPHRPPADLAGLTPREYEVLQAVAEGLSNQQIAERHFVSVSTVKTHLKNLYRKLEVARRTQAVQRAREIGLLP